MKIRSFFVVFVSFIVFLFLFLPYSKIYNYLIYKVLKRSHISASYQIKKASLFSVELRNLNVVLGSKNYKIKKLSVHINPLFLVSSNLGSVTLNGNEAKFKIFRKSDFKSFLIKGSFYTTLLKNFFYEPYRGMLEGFRGKNSLTAEIKIVGNGIVLQDLRVAGKFDLKAKGYISGNSFTLRGYVKVGKIKHDFSI